MLKLNNSSISKLKAIKLNQDKIENINNDSLNKTKTTKDLYSEQALEYQQNIKKMRDYSEAKLIISSCSDFGTLKARGAGQI